MAYREVILADNPVGYWRLNDSGTTATDASSGIANPGTLNGTVTKSVAGVLAGDADKCMSFDGSTGYINIPYHVKLDIVGAISIEFWLKPASYSGSQIVLGKDYTLGYYVAAGAILSFWTHNTQLQASYANDSAWHHVVCTSDGSGNKNIYVDGALAAGPTAQSAPIADANALQFGRSPVLANFYNGALDEVAIYGAALSAAKVLSHYQSGTYPFSTVTYAASSN